MLTKLVLRNFQRHRKLNLRFDKITTIVGRSDAGKSAVVRALRWALLNRPSGTKVVRRGASLCRVAVTLDDHKIQRRRGKSKNSYQLDDVVYQAFGNDVPAPITDVAKVREDNFQKQHDDPYWLSLSPGELSRALNEVVDLSLIDRVLQYINRQLREVTAAVKASKARIKELKAERKRLRFVKRLVREYDDLQQVDRAVRDARGRADRLQELVAAARETKARARTASTMSREIDAAVGQAAAVVDRIKEGRDRAERLGDLIASYDKWERQVKKNDEQLKTVERALTKYDHCPLCGAKR